MDLQNIAYFKEVAEQESITKAAETLHVSQPALSKTVRKLEDELGTPLFDRVGRTIKLNDNGRVLMHYTDKALRAMDTARKEIQRKSVEEEHTVKFLRRLPLGQPGYGHALLKKECPELIMQELLWSETRKVPDAELELFATRRKIEEENVRFLCAENIVAVVPSTHPLAKRKSIDLRKMKDEQFIFSAPSEMSEIAHEACLASGFEPKVSATLPIYTDVLGFVSHGLGCAIAPSVSWLAGWPKDSGFTVLGIANLERKRNIYLRWPADAQMKPATRELGLFLERFYRNHCK